MILWKCITFLFFLVSATEVKYEPLVETTLESTSKHEFQAEVSRLMDIIINSLYTQKDIFLRELVSNSADALEKIRFLSVADPTVLGSTPELGIYIQSDKEAKTLTIRDTGVGMTRTELVNNLGVMAKSGTSNFLEAVASGEDVNLIGQFGVGFYSAFLVADKVTVVSKHVNDTQHVWISSADPYFTVAADPRGDTLGRGTEITLHLKEDALEYLSTDKVKDLAMKYSQFTPFEIRLYMDKEVPVESESEESIDEETGKPEKPEMHTIQEWTLINTQKAIWLRPADEVTEEEYMGFYGSMTKDNNNPIAHLHFHAEGEVEFKALAYIPSKPERDYLFTMSTPKQRIRLYARRVLVSDEFRDLLPKWMSFVRGVVDSNDLPLKVDREQLTQHKVLKVIGKRLSRKVLDLIKKMQSSSEEEKEELEKKIEEMEPGLRPPMPQRKSRFELFTEEYADALRIGCIEDEGNRKKIAKVMLFTSSKRPSVSLEDYLSGMQDDQTHIYYMSGNSIQQISESPHMKIFLEKDIEVLYLTGHIDEPCLARIKTFEGKTLTSIEKGDLKLTLSDEEKKRQKALTKMFHGLTEWMTNLLKNKVAMVILSHRLKDIPMMVVAPEWGYSGFGEKVLKAQGLADIPQMDLMAQMRTLEINPSHPVIHKLMKLVSEDPTNAQAISLTSVLFDSALIAGGFEVPSPQRIADAVMRGVAIEMGVNPNAKPVEIEIPEEYYNSQEVDEEEEGEDMEPPFEADFPEMGGDDEPEMSDSTKDEL